MSIQSINNNVSTIQRPYTTNIYTTKTTPDFSNVYKADSIAFNTAPPQRLPPPTTPPTPPDTHKTEWGTIGRLGLMVAGSSAVCGGIGYAIGNAAGRAALGAGIGAGVGAVLPIALLVYALRSFT